MFHLMCLKYQQFYSCYALVKLLILSTHSMKYICYSPQKSKYPLYIYRFCSGRKLVLVNIVVPFFHRWYGRLRMYCWSFSTVICMGLPADLMLLTNFIIVRLLLPFWGIFNPFLPGNPKKGHRQTVQTLCSVFNPVPGNNIGTQTLKIYSLIGNIKMIWWNISCNTSEMV